MKSILDNPKLYEARREYPVFSHSLPLGDVAGHPNSTGYAGWACEACRPRLGCNQVSARIFDHQVRLSLQDRPPSRRLLKLRPLELSKLFVCPKEI